MTFYPWQKKQVDFILSQYQQQRLPHALLCHGAKGLAKVAFAKALAGVLLCTSESSVACGDCKSCHLFQLGNHPDFYEVTLEEKSKSIKVDQVRALSDKLFKTAQLQGYQVALIYPADLMNRASANALLKTLEEPPGQVAIILVADQLAGIPATILSRTQKLDFSPPTRQSILPWLKDQLSIESAEAEKLLALADGAPMLALEMGRRDDIKLRNQLMKSLWQLLQQEVTINHAASAYLKQDLVLVIQMMYLITLDVLKTHLNSPAQSLQNQGCERQFQFLCQKTNKYAITKLLPELLQTKQRLQTVAGVNVQLLLEATLLRWQQCVKQ